MEKTSKSFLWWGVILAIGCLCIWGIRSCNLRDARIKEEKRLERENEKLWERAAMIDDPYLYLDKNGVYHITQDCYKLKRGYVYDDEKQNATYSVSYQSKNDIKDWIDFAAHNQLCIECFTRDILDELSMPSVYLPDSIYEYDENSNPIKKVYYACDQYGNLIMKESWEYVDGQWKGTMKDEYEYDAYGREIMSASYFWEDGEWKGYTYLGNKSDIEYDNFNNVIRQTYYEWKDHEWIIDSKIEYTYDEHNNPNRGKHFKLQKKIWKLEKTKTYENFY